MKINEILTEEPVISSWIDQITLQRNGRDVTMTLNNKNHRRRYVIKNVPYATYINWIQTGSKGRFWHRNIRGKYVVKKIVRM